MKEISAMKIFVRSVLSLVLFTSLVMPVLASSEILLKPSSGYYTDNITVEVAVRIPEAESVNGVSFQLVFDERLSVDDYVVATNICDLDGVIGDGKAEFVCLAKPGDQVLGNNSLVEVHFSSKEEGEYDITIENIDLGLGANVMKSEGTYLLEISEENIPAVAGVVNNSATSLINAKNLYGLVLILVILAVLITVLLVIRNRKKNVVQYRMFGMLLFGLGTIGLIAGSYLVREENLDSRSDAGYEVVDDIPYFDNPSNSADLNQDGVLDTVDYEIFYSDMILWKKIGELNSRSDLNDDLMINIDDYSIFVEEYSKL